MRSLHAAVFASLGLFSGCGGCDSCFSSKEPGDVVPAATPATAPPPTVERRVVDAAPPVEHDASTSEHDAGITPVPVLTMSAVPRPSGAPMPMGAFQSCGVYDAPRCEKTCDKGNCRQECDGVECELACTGGYCSQLCGAQATCRMTCNGGHCIQTCTKKDGCIRECAGGDCK
jgi:hypothetical protein